MRSDGKWIHTHFDDYGRNIATGFVNQSGILTVSSNQTFSDSLSRTWYDGAGIPGSGNIYNGKVSRGRERILGTNDWIDTRTYYDSYGRVDKTRGNHHLRLYRQRSGLGLQTTSSRVYTRVKRLGEAQTFSEAV